MTYDVYFGTSSSPPLVSNDQSGATYDPGTLAYNTKYYWKIVATDSHGATTTGPLWDFTTGSVPNNPPNTPSSPSPANHATGVLINADLSWSGGDPDAGDTVTYDVYFGTSETPPLEETIGPYPATQSSITYDPMYFLPDVIPEPIPEPMTFYWQIVAMDNHGVTREGPLWDFTTPGVWNPWAYDEDGSGYTEIGELLHAISDYIGGEITISQLLEIIDLYISHTPKP